MSSSPLTLRERAEVRAGRMPFALSAAMGLMR